MRQYPGNYTAFLEARREEERDAAPPPTAKAERPARREPDAPATRRLSFKERRELEETEARIQTAEQRQAEIETELAANASDAYAVHRLYEEREQLALRLARDLDRWAELAEHA